MKTILTAPRNGSVTLTITGPNGVKILLQWFPSGRRNVEAPSALPAVTKRNLLDLMTPERHETTLETAQRVRTVVESARDLRAIERYVEELP
jgi:hypothetical protein